MLSRAVRSYSFWILLSFTIFQAAVSKNAGSGKDSPNAYCDDEYRSKYIAVSKSLFSKQDRHHSNHHNRHETSNSVVNATRINKSHENSDGAAKRTSASHKKNRNVNAHNGLHCRIRAKNDNRRRSLRAENRSHQSSSNEFSAQKSITNYLEHKLQANQSKYNPVSISIKAMIDIKLDDEQSKSNDVGSTRRKRTAVEEWEGENSCRPSRRIIGGSAAKNIEDLPYMVFVDTGCGGSIIGDSWILTASHCINPDGPDHIYAGSLKLHSGCKHKIERIVKHPNYNEKLFIFDIALLKLFQPLIFSPAIKSLSMPFKSPKPGECGMVSGWGATMVDGEMVYDMRTAFIPVVDKKRCSMFRNIGDGQFCAGFRDAQSDSCQGDSGGPFVVKGNIVGIVSYGYKCAVPETPGVYVDVAYFRSWISNVTGI